jgi:NAD-dependent dihydropyrimidine dehydrogenase PreA subunit
MSQRIAVVVSQGQSAHPAKRQLEEDIVAGLLAEPGIDLVVIPHLYDLTPEGTGVLALRSITGPMIVLSWLYERATRWTLDRFGIRGREGLTLLKAEDEDDEDLDDETDQSDQVGGNGDPAAAKTRVIDQRGLPERRIYCLDLRLHATAQPYLDEIRRIVRENRLPLLSLDVAPSHALPMAPNPHPPSDGVPSGDAASPGRASPPASVPQTLGPAQLQRIDEEAGRRWYPVIDYSRCTNCMECIDFCLFGVYGVDKAETIIVEQPDNCRKGCPACSRVCPENAIIFPQHKTPTIAGAPVVAGALKIDLSKLFGAPETGETAEQAAIRERDEQLILAGRAPVGALGGLPKRQAAAPPQPKDELDALLDALDNF